MRSIFILFLVSKILMAYPYSPDYLNGNACGDLFEAVAREPEPDEELTTEELEDNLSELEDEFPDSSESTG